MGAVVRPCPRSLALCDAFAPRRVPRATSLMDNAMEDEGARAVADALPSLPALTDLW